MKIKVRHPVEGKVSQGRISCCQTWKCLVVLTVFQTCYTGMKSHSYTHSPPPYFGEVLSLLRVLKDDEGLSSIPCHYPGTDSAANRRNISASSGALLHSTHVCPEVSKAYSEQVRESKSICGSGHYCLILLLALGII